MTAEQQAATGLRPVMTAWRPGLAWFGEHCPEPQRIADCAAALDKLRPVWANNED